LVENETGKRLNCIRSDNGGEYYSKEFDDYCSYHGIYREKTVLGTPKVLEEIKEMKFQRYQKIKMYKNRSSKHLKLLQVLLEYLPG
jgi:hypothetical protein